MKASGYGGRAVRKDIGNILDNLGVTYTYPDGTVFSYTANQFAAGGFQDISETFICEKGAVNTSRQGYKLWDKPQKVAAPTVVETKGDITAEGVNQFIEGARTGKLENAAFTAAESTLTAIMAREAIYTGREMTWDQLVKA